MSYNSKTIFSSILNPLLIWFKRILFCSFFFITFYLNAEQPTKNSNKPLIIALPDSSAINAAPAEKFNLLVNFLKEYWQVWAIDNKREIQFVYFPESDQATEALLKNEIDVIAITRFTQKPENILYSLPYAKLQQRLYRRIKADDSDGLQIGVYSETSSILSFLDKSVEMTYYNNPEELVSNYSQYDAIYSDQPWKLATKIKEHKIGKEFYVSTNDAPEIFLRFAFHKNNRDLALLINDSLRSVSVVQARLWQNKYLPKNEDSFLSLALGQYLTELTEQEKKYVLDNNQISFPIAEQGFPPYLISRGFNNITERGFTIELINIMTNKVGIEYQPYYIKNAKETFSALKEKKVNLLLTMQKTPIREHQYLFSVPYIKAGYSIVYRIDETPINNIKQIGSRSIAVAKNHNITQRLQQKLPNATFIFFDTVQEAVESVAHSKSNVFIGRSLNASYLIQQKQLSNLISHPLADFHGSGQFSFATSLDNPELINLLNRTINSISADTFDAMHAKWSKTAFKGNNANERVAIVYRNVTYLFSAILVFGLIIFWIYYRQLRTRKITQQKIEHALAIAEIAKIEAEKSAQAKITFLARMSHEIRTPMNGVLGMAEALSFTSLNKEQTDLLDTLKGSARNLLALLNDVLDFSKMDAGKLTLESVPVNFHLLCKNIVTSFKHAEHNKALTINLEIDSKITHNYFTDPTRLTQVLNNLLSNAIKFTEKGDINLIVSLIESDITNNNTYDILNFDIKDTGIGIAKNKQAFLFTPFIQADDDITRKFGGTGLGLSICQEIVTAMGSEIKIDSAIDQGSTFHFTLKLKQSNIKKSIDKRKNTRRINAPNDDRFKGLRVLIAEDNLVNVKVLSSQLQRLNITADIAYDGKEALELHEKQAYDIIISDCHMPNVDGFELAQTLTEQVGRQPLWLIAVTADALSGAAEKCMAAGFDDYMAKPCPQEEITNKLNNAYRQISKQQEQHEQHEQEHKKTIDQQFTLFNLEVLLKNNEQDIELSKNVGQLFITSWQKEKQQWLSAAENYDHKYIQALAHKLKGSIRYFAHDELVNVIDHVNQNARTQNRDNLIESVSHLYLHLDILANEIKGWLSSESI